MTFSDWVRESAHRYRNQPPGPATRQTVSAFARGAFRRAGVYLGRPIWQRGDWDVLVILDATRFDLWQEVAPEYGLPANRSVWSNASCSIDWINRNFNQHPSEAARTGYVTANPFTHHYTDECQSADLGDGTVGFLDPLYRTHWQECTPEGFEGDGIMTVPPEPVTDHTIQAWRERSELGVDRLVVHYLQPHEPYLSRPEWGNGNHRLFDNMITDGAAEAGASIWPRVRDGDVPVEELWAAMEENLRWVLDDVTERLLPNLDGRVVLSSDHGNALGEWGEWHHPSAALGPSVRRVPWAAVDCEDEQTIQPTVEYGSVEDRPEYAVSDQLAALGYQEGSA